MELILQSLYLILPAYFANAFGTIAGKLKLWTSPLDNNRKLVTNYIFGPGKTYGGTIIGIIVALLTVGLQRLLFSIEFFQNISIIDYQYINWLYLGLLAGIGSVGGDIVASFIKRRLHLQRGVSVPLLDQWDFLIGYLLLISILIDIPQSIIIISFIITLIIHPLSNIVAYLLKIKKVWW